MLVIKEDVRKENFEKIKGMKSKVSELFEEVADLYRNEMPLTADTRNKQTDRIMELVHEVRWVQSELEAMLDKTLKEGTEERSITN